MRFGSMPAPVAVSCKFSLTILTPDSAKIIEGRAKKNTERIILETNFFLKTNFILKFYNIAGRIPQSASWRIGDEGQCEKKSRRSRHLTLEPALRPRGCLRRPGAGSSS